MDTVRRFRLDWLFSTAVILSSPQPHQGILGNAWIRFCFATTDGVFATGS